MKTLSLTTLVLSAILPIAAFAQAGKNCVPSTPSSSSAYAEFLRSDLASNWSASTFGPLKLMSGGEFLECTTSTEPDGFAMALSNSGTTALALGYAVRGTEEKALVFQVSETGSGKFTVKAFEVTGAPVLSFTVNNGTVSDIEFIGGRTGCSGVYLTGMVEVVGGTLAGGPIGFAVGMGMMMFQLWDAGCY